MKKFLTLVVATIVAFGATAFAQTRAIEQDRFFDETYVGITIGEDGMGKSGDWVGMNAGLRLGKWFTPQFGLELEGTAQFNDFYKRINSHRVGVNALVNLNYLNGYRGHRNDCEFVPFVGLGWQRNYNPCEACQSPFGNYLYTKMGLQVNVNMGKGWQFNIIPQVAYNLSGPGKLQYNVNYLDYGIALGVTYNFKNSHGTHFFKVSDAVYTQAQMDEVLALTNELRANNETLRLALEDCMNRPTETTVVEEKTVETKTVTKPVFATIGFERNSAKILGVYDLNVRTIADFMKASDQHFTVVGFASEEGNAEYNEALSLRRAQAVATALESYGVDPAKIHVEGKGATTEFGTALDLNRTVQIMVE